MAAIAHYAPGLPLGRYCIMHQLTPWLLSHVMYVAFDITIIVYIYIIYKQWPDKCNVLV
jgi:hypothetical protein